ncbi:hypothetical protein H4R33_001030 [Dimargaris cristalligena]|nr:hypothetical protein H4R33_001030 [Dimargaris cristalligena]
MSSSSTSEVSPDYPSPVHPWAIPIYKPLANDQNISILDHPAVIKPTSRVWGEPTTSSSASSSIKHGVPKTNNPPPSIERLIANCQTLSEYFFPVDHAPSSVAFPSQLKRQLNSMLHSFLLRLTADLEGDALLAVGPRVNPLRRGFNSKLSLLFSSITPASQPFYIYALDWATDERNFKFDIYSSSSGIQCESLADLERTSSKHVRFGRLSMLADGAQIEI